VGDINQRGCARGGQGNGAKKDKTKDWGSNIKESLHWAGGSLNKFRGLGGWETNCKTLTKGLIKKKSENSWKEKHHCSDAALGVGLLGKNGNQKKDGSHGGQRKNEKTGGSWENPH